MRFSYIFFLVFSIGLFSSNANALTLSGTVYGGSDPLQGALINVFNATTSQAQDNQLSDATGQYAFTLDPGSYSLEITPPEGSVYGVATVSNITLQEDEIRNVALLSESSVLSGIVSLPDGSPVVGGEINIYRQSASPRSGASAIAQTETDESGAYTFNLVPDTYMLQLYVYDRNIEGNAGYYNHDSVAENLDLSSDHREDLVLPYVTVSGSTVDSNGIPIPNVEISIPDTASGPDYEFYSGNLTIYSDGQGKYSFKTPASTYNVLVSPPSSNEQYGATEYLDVDLTDDTVRDFIVQSSNVLSGTITLPDGSPVIGGRVLAYKQSASPRSGASAIAQTETDANGAYTFSLAPDTYMLQLYVYDRNIEGNAGYYNHDSVAENLDLSSDHREDLVLPYVTVSGSTVDSNGIPIPNVEITIPDTASGPDYEFFSGNLTIYSDAQGKYSFKTPASTYNVLVSPPSSSDQYGATEYLDVDLTDDAVRDFIVQSSNVLSGTITLPDGSPVVGGRVLAYKQSASPRSGASAIAQTETDESGAYTFNLVPDTYMLQLYVYDRNIEGNAGYYNHDSVAENLDLSSDHREDLVLPYVTVSGSTVDSNGIPIPNVEISIPDTASGPDYEFYSGNLTVNSDAQGEYLFRTPASTYNQSVRASENSGFSAAAIDNVNFNNDTIQDIVLVFEDITPPQIVAGPFVSAIAQNSALVEWQTNEPTNSQVTVGDVEVDVAGLRTLHSIALTSLQADSLYLATVTGVDSEGNGPVTKVSDEFRTAALPDTTTPEITMGPFVTGIGVDRAMVTWTTSEPATTELQFGVSDLSEYRSIEGLRSVHEIELNELEADTRYQLSISAVDSDGNGPVESSLVSFQTLPLPDTRAPDIVVKPLLSDVADTEATIIWTTDEPSVSGLTLFDGERYDVYGDEVLKQDHVIRLTGLEPEQQYFYTISARDSSENGPTISEQREFTTRQTPDLQAPVLVSPVRVFAITDHSAQIEWQLDEPATGIVEYGELPTSLNLTVAKANLTTDTDLQISGLENDSTYYYRVRSVDSKGNEWISQIDSFRTRINVDESSPTFMEQPVVVASSNSAVTLEWQSNEPSIAVIEYQGDAGSQRYNVTEFTVDAQATLTGLDADQQYQFTVELTDKSGNQKLFDSSVATVASPTNSGDADVLLDDGAITGFSTTSEIDTSAPQFAINPDTVASSPDRVLLRWVSDEPTTAELRFGLTGQLANRAIASTTISSEHFVMLSNLESHQIYDVNLTIIDVAGNVTSTVISGITPSTTSDTTSPLFVASPVMTSIAESEISIAWQADEYSTAELNCRRTFDDARWSANSEKWAVEGELNLNGLELDSQYVCVVVLTDLSGNKTESVTLQLATPGDSSDIDNDGLSNEQERLIGTDPTSADTDSDGVNDDTDRFPLDPTEAIDTDNDGLGDNADLDDDGDALPDVFEIANNLGPLNPLDAAQDADGDGWTNLQEYTQGTEVTFDDNPPELIVPPYLLTQSTGAKTVVFVGEAIAIDALDGSVSVALDKPGPYVPGRHLLTWSAADLAGNRVEELQVLDVLPTVSFGQPIEVGEGGIVEAELLLNGYAPTYPVIIEYGIVGTAQGGQDYQVPDDSQVVTIEEGLNAFIEVQIIADSELEGAEEIVLTIESVSGAVSGTSARQLITIQETNRKPTVEISFKQNDRLVSTVLTSAGPVEVIATISDPNQEDSHQLNWQSSDSDSRIEMPETTTENSWFFNPDSLDPQFYQIQVNVTDDGQPSLNSAATSTFKVLADTPVLLASSDQDNDGISDLLEGYGDADGDRIADYLDLLTATNLLPLDISGQMLQSEPGTNLRLGLAAFASNGSGARIEPLAESETSADAIETLPPAEPAFEFLSGVIDFEVTGLLPGSISNIVVPLDSAIPEAAQYRKYTTEFGWSVFAEDAENQISTALGGEGCPAPRAYRLFAWNERGSHVCTTIYKGWWCERC